MAPGDAVTRIVSLAPHLTELAFAAGAGDRLVGVSAFSDFPDAAKKLPQVGGGANLDLERIVALQPDLILAWQSGNSPFAIARLQAMGFHVYVSEARKLDDIATQLRTIGKLSGTEAVAEPNAKNFEQQLLDLRRHAQTNSIVTTFVDIWQNPFITVNGQHIISDVLSLCGGKNVFANAPTLTPAIGLEALLGADPEAIIGGDSATNADNFAHSWHIHPQLNAVRNGHIYFVHPDIIQRPTLRILEGAKRICDGLDRVRRQR